MDFERQNQMSNDSSFFVLQQPLAGSPEDQVSGTRAVKAQGTKMGPGARCPLCQRFIGMLTWMPPYHVEVEMWGQSSADVIIAGASTLLVSSRFKQMYFQNRLMGLEKFDAVEVVATKRHRRRTDPLPEYRKADVSPSESVVDQDRSEFVWEDKASLCPCCLRDGKLHGYSRVVIDPRTWNGEDVFTPKGSPVNFVVSDRFRIICEKSEISGVVFVPVEQCTWKRRPGEP